MADFFGKLVKDVGGHCENIDNFNKDLLKQFGNINDDILKQLGKTNEEILTNLNKLLGIENNTPQFVPSRSGKPAAYNPYDD